MKKKIEKWLIESVDNINNGSYSESVDIDEFIAFDIQDAKKILEITIETANIIKEFSFNNNLDNISITLFLELTESLVLNGVIKNEDIILKDIDLLCVPEIVIYKINDNNSIPLVEFYRSPLPFKINGLNDSISIFYKEYRRLEEMLNNEPYTRHLSFVFNNTQF